MLRDSVAHLDISLHGSAISLLQDKVSVKVEAPIMISHLVHTWWKHKTGQPSKVLNIFI